MPIQSVQCIQIQPDHSTYRHKPDIIRRLAQLRCDHRPNRRHNRDRPERQAIATGEDLSISLDIELRAWITYKRNNPGLEGNDRLWLWLWLWILVNRAGYITAFMALLAVVLAIGGLEPFLVV